MRVGARYHEFSIGRPTEKLQTLSDICLDHAPDACTERGSDTLAAQMRGGTYVLNFYSAVFVDQLKRGRKTATIRLGDKSGKYERGQVVWVTVGFRHSPREKIFTAVIDDVEVKRLGDLSRRDIEHDNPEFRRLEDEQQASSSRSTAGRSPRTTRSP